MKLKPDFNTVIDCYSKLKAGKKVSDAPIASILLASKENEHGHMFEDGIHYQGYFFWFASVPMMIECLWHHNLTDFKDEALCRRYKELYAIKRIFKDQLTKDGKVILTAEEWRDKWFRGYERRISSSAYIELQEKNLTPAEEATWVEKLSKLRSSISYGTLMETRDDPRFPLILEWTKQEPCIWLDKLIPADHHLSKNLGRWTRFNHPQSGHEHFPFKLVNLEKYDGEIVYNAKNQLTLPDGILIQPSQIQIITEEQAKTLYQASILVHWPTTKEKWGYSVPITKLRNPKGTDLASVFNPDLNWKTWHKYADSGAKAPKKAQGDYAEFNYKRRKEEFIEHMNDLKTLPVQESLFRKKYIEIANDRTSDLRLMRVVRKIWQPRNIFNEQQTIEEIQNLDPVMIFVDNTHPTLVSDWHILRTYSHSMEFARMPRLLRFLVVDKKSQKYLGVVSLGGDALAIAVRDELIGWSQKDRLQDGKLRNTAIGSCIMPIQPFGFNFLGGKLVAALLTTKSVRDIWKLKYKDTLVGFTTTSLYGKRNGKTMYDDTPQWDYCGLTRGTISLTPDVAFLDPWRKHLNIKSKANETGAKQKIIKEVFKELGLKAKDYEHGYERGVYFAGVYANYKEFLRGKIKEKDLILGSKFEKDVQGVLDWWRPIAIGRYKSLVKRGTLRDQVPFYHRIKRTEDSPAMFEEAYSLYRDEVGG